jgi:formylglycine-generating enzyme required for sulfatase activity
MRFPDCRLVSFRAESIPAGGKLMLTFHRQSLAGLFWIRLCVAHLGILLIVITVLILAGVLAVHAEAADHAGKIFRDCEMCPEMVIIPPGKYIMGSPETEKDRDADEEQHTVVITYSFAVSKGPITWDLWDACVQDGVCDGPSVEAALKLDRDGKPIQDYVDHVRGNHPVVGVSWWDAHAFVHWLNRKIGKEKYRLLSESEFEYAARAGTTTVYWWGNEPSHDYANYGKDTGPDLGGKAEGRDIWEDSTSPVCSFPTNAFGLCDMHGNVYQWVEDCYETNVALLPADGSAVKSGNCSVRGFRSNSFESNAKTLRSANRAFVYAPNTRGRNYLGFRVAKTLK